MHKALLTDSPIKLLRVWLSRCQSSLSSLPLTYKNMYVCVCVYCFHAQIMLFTSTRVHTSVSVFVYVASLLQTDGNLRHNAGGLSFEAPLPPAHFPPPCPLPATPHPHHFPPSHLSAHQAEKKASILHRQAPEPDCRQWNPLQLLWRYKSSPVFDTITQTGKGNADVIFI